MGWCPGETREILPPEPWLTIFGLLIGYLFVDQRITQEEEQWNGYYTINESGCSSVDDVALCFFLGVGNDGVEDAEDVLTGDESPIHVVSLPSSPWRCRVCLFARPVCLHNSMA